MFSAQKQKIIFFISGIICLLAAVCLICNFAGKFNDLHEENTVIEETITPREKNNAESNEIAEEKADKPSGEITVYVTGEVKKPGVFTLKSGARVYNALALAGGFTNNADKLLVNLAAKIYDGEHLHFPALSENNGKKSNLIPAGTAKKQSRAKKWKTTDSNVSVNSYRSSKMFAEYKININSQDTEELAKIPGVGVKTAEKIIYYRRDHGDFNRKEDIIKVKGIGAKKYQKIRDYITVGE